MRRSAQGGTRDEDRRELAWPRHDVGRESGGLPIVSPSALKRTVCRGRSCRTTVCDSLTTTDGAWLPRGAALGRRLLAEVATIVTPDTIPSLAPTAHRAEMDALEAPPGTSPHASGDSPPGCADCDRKPQLGLHAHPGRAEESGSSRGTVDDRHDPQAGHSTER